MSRVWIVASFAAALGCARLPYDQRTAVAERVSFSDLHPRIQTALSWVRTPDAWDYFVCENLVVAEERGISEANQIYYKVRSGRVRAVCGGNCFARTVQQGRYCARNCPPPAWQCKYPEDYDPD